MISDVLSDAVDEITTYQTDHAKAYSSHAAELDAVTTVMDAMRAVLDSADPNNVADLRRTILQLNVTPIKCELKKLADNSAG